MLFVLILSVMSLALSVRSDQPTWSVVLRNNAVGLLRIIRDQRGVVACSSKLITLNLWGLFQTFLQSIWLICTASNYQWFYRKVYTGNCWHALKLSVIDII